MKRIKIYIEDEESSYFVYENGEIYNSKTKRFLKGSVFNSGYRFVSLSVNNKSKNYAVHRLVAEAFLPNPLKLPIVNHIDGNKLNNNVENLEWVTAQKNSQHAHDTGLITDKRTRWNKVLISNEELSQRWRQYRNTNYFISKNGTVYNQKTMVLLNKIKRSDGYECVSLCSNGKRKSKLVHCLLATAWMGYDESSDFVVNHKDGNKNNNSLSNLEIVPKKENVQHSCYSLGNCTKKVVRYKPGEEDVVYPSVTVCARENGVCVSTISLAIKTHSKSNKGQYYYKFLEE